jgi:hypothetical protein
MAEDLFLADRSAFAAMMDLEWVVPSCGAILFWGA